MPNTPDIDVETAAFLTACGGEIRRAREQRGWSRADLITASGLTVAASTLAAQELGVRDMSAFELSQHCRALGIASNVLFDTAYREVLGSTNHLYVDLTALAHTNDELLRRLRPWARTRVDDLPVGAKATVLLTDSPLDDMADRCGVSRAKLIRALRAAGMAHAPSVRKAAPPVMSAREGGLEVLESEDVIARWPFLAPIVELPGPLWKFHLVPGGMLACARTYDSYAESLWVIDEDHIGLSRTPIRGRPGPVASTVDVAGSAAEVLDVLQQPVRWEDEP